MADSEVGNFLKELAGEQQESILDKPLNLGTDEEPEKETPVRKVELDEDGYPKNRQGRRKRERDEQRDSEIQQLNERVKVLSESEKFKEEVGDDYKKLLEPIFGTAGDDGKYDPRRELATKNLIAAFDMMKESSKKEVLKALESRNTEESNAQREADSEVEAILDTAEEYGINIEDEDTRSGFLTFVEKMSAKYKDGNVKEFPDADNVAEAFIAISKSGGSSRAKELASRGMTRSGESQPSNLQQNAIERYMEDNGLAW